FLGEGLPGGGVAHLAISPGFDDDGILFAAQAVGGSGGLGIWKSDTGGRTWYMANDGLDDLAIVDLVISPAFASDGTLFALTRSQGLFRSVDRGGTWQALADRYLPAKDSYDSPGLIAVSPTYGVDHTLYVAHQGLHRSTDGGDTWTLVRDTGAQALALAPGYATSHTLYGWFGDTGLLRSGDGGDSWQPASAGLLIDGYGTPRLLLGRGTASAADVYFFWDPSAPDEVIHIWRSTDAGATWQRLAGEPPKASTRLDLAPDGLAFLGLDGNGRLVRWPIADLRWEAPSLPALNEIVFDRVVLPPNFRGDGQADPTQQVLYGVTSLAGVLFSPDAGLTWTTTGFPQRQMFSAPENLLVLSGGDTLAATPLGLYRYTPGGEWALIEGGLPPGAAVSGLARGEDGALCLLVEQAGVLRVFLSTDGGNTWADPLPSLPVPAIADDLYASPAFAHDLTMFLVTSQSRPLRSRGGGPWTEIGPPGDWQLSAFEMSPALDRDGILFVRTDTQALWRSTDFGDAWQQVAGPWPADMPPTGIHQGPGYRLPALTFSPDFGSDRVAFTQVGDTVYRSSDAGETWRAVLDLGPGIVHTVFSPAYAGDGVVYLLQGQSVYHSTDRGASWQALPTVPWSAFDEFHLEISPTFAQDR
ncbi:MAG: WD40/YVTN/BNR-like repeat-containing protein, partial [Anaerolineae bacterium]